MAASFWEPIRPADGLGAGLAGGGGASGAARLACWAEFPTPGYLRGWDKGRDSPGLGD
jgi:hypothetical protein